MRFSAMQGGRFFEIVSLAALACVAAIVIASFIVAGRHSGVPGYTPWAPASMLSLSVLGVLLARQRRATAWAAMVVSALSMAVAIVWATTTI